MKLKDQPFLVTICNENNSIDEVFVVVDKTKWRFEHLLEAVDVLFKTFFVFDIEYPAECRAIWEFVQVHFYRFNLAKKNSSVTNFLKKINN
jgi:hypothetical protein